MKQFNKGDIISVPKFPGVKHVGLVIGPNQVAHCTPRKGTIISTLEDFSQGETITFVRRVKNMEVAVYNAIRMVARGRKYDLFFWNCEHFISKCEGENEISPQLRNAGGVVSLLIIFLIITRR